MAKYEYEYETKLSTCASVSHTARARAMTLSPLPEFCDTLLLQLFYECEYTYVLHEVSRHWHDILCDEEKRKIYRQHTAQSGIFVTSLMTSSDMAGDITMTAADNHGYNAIPGSIVLRTRANENSSTGIYSGQFKFTNPRSVQLIVSQGKWPAGTDQGSSDTAGRVSALGAKMCVDIMFCSVFEKHAPFVVVSLVSSPLATRPVYADRVTRYGFIICNPNDMAVDVTYMVVGTTDYDTRSQYM